ncbi:MAG: extracellular solute-binding protein [Clostridia bacterium]|nr:extracellular solute-binding protein [Clostridia bacterium]
MKRLVSLFLALVMVLSLSVSLAEVTYPLTTEPVTITIAVAQHNSDAVEDFNTKYAIKMAEEVTGVHIEWIPIQEGNTTEKVATMLAGDLPDVFLGLVGDTAIAQNPSLFVPIEDMIEEYCPNIYATYEESVDGWRTFMTYPDGHIYGLIANYRFNPNNAINGTMWINQTWLDNLGLAMPTTLKELEEVLIAFRDLDADGDGDATNEIPWDWCQKYYAAKWAEIAFMFGSTMGSRGGGWFDIVDGKVTGAAREENFRAALEYMNYLCKEGLLNIEGITQTSDQYNANVDGGKVGVFTEWTNATHISDPELRAQYVYVGPLSAEGYTFRTMPSTLTANRNGFVITSACENVELALQWWDYMSRDVAATHAARSGPEGLTWEMIDGVPTSRSYTAEDAIAFGYESIAQHAGTSVFAASMGLTNCPPMIVDSLAAAPGGSTQTRAYAVKSYEPYYTEQSMSVGIVPTEAQEEFDFATEGLSDHINAFAAESIMNGVTDDSWNAYLKKLDDLNYDYYLEFMQKKLEGNWD